MLGYPIKYIKMIIQQFEKEKISASDSNTLINSIMNKFKLDSNVMKNLK